jgi:tyrosyl-DNA phosphodiesterase-1
MFFETYLSYCRKCSYKVFYRFYIQTDLFILCFVKNHSFEGYQAGDSLLLSQNSYEKQQSYINPLLCSWKADITHRSKASPHIKTYIRVHPNSSELDWFCLTSANLSKAAWGTLQKGKGENGHFLIRSYELGVLIYPDLFKVITF